MTTKNLYFSKSHKIHNLNYIYNKFYSPPSKFFTLFHSGPWWEFYRFVEPSQQQDGHQTTPTSGHVSILFLTVGDCVVCCMRSRSRVGVLFVYEAGYHPRKKIHVIRVCSSGPDNVCMYIINAGFRLTCRLPHCRFDDDICSTAQAPLAAEGWPSDKQRQANGSITLPLCPPRQIADSWILFNSGAMPLGDKAKAALPLGAATLKQQTMITRHSGKAAKRQAAN